MAPTIASAKQVKVDDHIQLKKGNCCGLVGFSASSVTGSLVPTLGMKPSPTPELGHAHGQLASKLRASLTWGQVGSFQLLSGYRIIGYIRIFDKEQALNLCKRSGQLAEQQRWYVQPVAWNEFPKLPAFVKWVPWEDCEDWATYTEKASSDCPDGLIRGRRQLGHRVSEETAVQTQNISTWILQQVPRHWQFDRVTDVLTKLDFIAPSILHCTPKRAHQTWTFKAS